MATITATFDRTGTFADDGHSVIWAALTTTDNYGSAVSMPGSTDRSFQIVGTLGAGGAVTLYGSNVVSPVLTDDADWFILTDPQGNNIVLSTLKGEAVTECVRWTRPKITAGDGATSLTAILYMRRVR